MTTSAALPATPAPSRKGVFVLLGALVAFATFVVFALYHFVLGPGLMKNATLRKRADAQTQILVLHTALEGWSSHNQGRYPDSLEALVQPDAQGHTLLGDALVLPKDPWGHDYVYAVPQPGELRPMLRSLGHDGLPGGEGEDADVEREGLVPKGR